MRETVTTIRQELLEILACPVPTCHGRLEQRNDRLVCQACGLRYRIEQTWPVLIPEEAEPPAAAPPATAAPGK